MTMTQSDRPAIRVLPAAEPEIIMAEVTETEAPAAPPTPARRPAQRGRKSNAERARIKAERETARIAAEEVARKAARLAEVESKRAIRVQPDTTGVLKLSFVLSAIVLVTAFTISYFTLASAAEWMRLPTFNNVDVLRFVVPGFAEVAIILSSVFYAIDVSRGGKGTRFKVVQWTLTMICAFANAAHTIREWGPEWGLQNWESLVGTALAAAAPLVVVWVSTSLSLIVFAQPEKSNS